MITLNRDATVPLQEQLVARLRYLIASGHWKSGETLPSTRVLARQLGISFHTVRKAYQQLEREGLLISRAGKGFTVTQRIPLTKSERLEQGASIVHEAMQQLIGLGLQESEIEYLVQEQLSLLKTGKDDYFLVVAESLELGELYARQLEMAFHDALEYTSIERVQDYPDVNYILAPFTLLPQLNVSSHVEKAGFLTHLPPEIIEAAVSLLSDQTLGLITRDPASIPPLTAAIRHQSGFQGQMVALALQDASTPLQRVVAQVDLLFYTPSTRKHLRVRPTGQKQLVLKPIVAPASVEYLRQHVPA